MAAKFLNDQLVTSKRFTPGHPHQSASDAPPAEEAELETILRREDQETRTRVTQRELAEIQKRRREVMVRLNETLDGFQQYELELRQHQQTCREMIEHISALPDTVTPAELANAKRLVERANMEVMQNARNRVLGTDSTHQDWSSLGFLRLSSLGLALTWPLILALLLGFAFIALSLAQVFGI